MKVKVNKLLVKLFEGRDVVCAEVLMKERYVLGLRALGKSLLERSRITFGQCVLLLATALAVTNAFGAPTSSQQAETVVRGFLRTDPQPLTATLGQVVKKSVTFQNIQHEEIYHVVFMEPSGFFIVPADDLVSPIIAFSSGDSFDPSDSNPFGALVSQDLASRVQRVRQLQKAKQAKGTNLSVKGREQTSLNHWKALSEASDGLVEMGLGSVSDVRVDPLVQSEWSQTTVSGDACYNYYTPPNAAGSASNYPDGCVATAMAQLMRFWQHPTAGIGTTSFSIEVDGVGESRSLRGGDGSGGGYVWSNMVLIPAGGTTLAERQAIGSLCHDASVSVNMSYTATGSGTDTLQAGNALRTTFGYANAVRGYNGSSNFDADDLWQMVNPNLDSGYPVLLGITGSVGGHAIVCDGYGYSDSVVYHHLNMGWAGNDDVWYNLPNIDSSPSFESVYKTVYNVYVTGSGEILSGRVTDSSDQPVSGATVTAVRSGGGTYTMSTSANGIYAFAKIPANSTYTVRASKPGYAFAEQTAATGTSSDYSPNSGNVWGVDFRGGSLDAPTLVAEPSATQGTVNTISWSAESLAFVRDTLDAPQESSSDDLPSLVDVVVQPAGASPMTAEETLPALSVVRVNTPRATGSRDSTLPSVDPSLLAALPRLFASTADDQMAPSLLGGLETLSDITIYDNTTSSGSGYSPGTSIELLDFGTGVGGTVTSFKIGYYTSLSSPGTVRIEFRTGTTSSTRGTFLVGFDLSGLSGSSSPGSNQFFEQTIDITGSEFDLLSGSFGYSYFFDNADTGAWLSSGGSGAVDGFWLNGNYYSSPWGGSPWAGLHMAVTASSSTPPDLQALSPSRQASTVTEHYPFWVKVQVNNGGTGLANSSHVTLYLSTDGDTDVSDDYLVGEKAVGVLVASSSEWVQWDFDMPDLGSGSYTIQPVFVVDNRDEVTESDESNTYNSGGSFTAVDAPTVYYAECADNLSFASPINSGWLTSTEHTFTGLMAGQTYWYRVKAGQGPTGNRIETGWSNVEWSINDATSPSCTITGDDGNPTAASTVHFSVDFSEDVTGFTQSDVDLTGTAPGKIITGLTGSGSNYTATVSNINGSGSVTIEITAGKCTDVAGNPNTAGGPTSYTIDQTASVISTITSATADGNYGQGAAIDVILNFSEDVTLVGGNLIVTLETGTTDRDVAISPFGLTSTISGTYTVQTGDMSTDLSVKSISISGGTLRDLAGNDASLIIPAGQNLDDNKDIVIQSYYELDSDGDGIPDWWETQYYGGGTNANCDAICSNGVNTVMQAYIAGIDPTQSDAWFIITSFGDSLHWNSVSGRVYSVYWTTNLLNEFIPLETNIPWPTNQFIDTLHGNEGSSFYKLKVELQE